MFYEIFLIYRNSGIFVIYVVFFLICLRTFATFQRNLCQYPYSSEESPLLNVSMRDGSDYTKPTKAWPRILFNNEHHHDLYREFVTTTKFIF
jgi:hypothetical protein